MYLREGLAINAQGHLEIGGCDSVELAREFGTPLYVYDEDYLRARCAGFTGALARYAPGGGVAYAGKAFLTTAMAMLMKQCGMWLDCVSLGELYVARRADFSAQRIILHGSNKTRAELETALDMGVGRVVLDSVDELDELEELCSKRGAKQKVFLRVNPGVDAHTHSYIQTARVDSKFASGQPDIRHGSLRQGLRQGSGHNGRAARGHRLHTARDKHGRRLLGALYRRGCAGQPGGFGAPSGGGAKERHGRA